MNNCSECHYQSKGLFGFVANEIRRANKNVYAATAFIDEAAVELIKELVGRNIRVRLVTLLVRKESWERKHMSHITALRELKCLEAQNPKLLRVYTTEDIHAKIYVIDGYKAITGSVNLTKSSDNNLEYVHVTCKPEAIHQLITTIFYYMLNAAFRYPNTFISCV